MTGVFLLGLVVTIPGALAGGDAAATKVDAMRASAVAGGLQAAENANRLAFISVMGISIIWFGLQRYRSSLLRLAGGAAVLVLVLTVFRSGSRSGALLLLLLAVLLMWQSGLKVQHIALIILTAFASIGLVITLVPEAVLDRILSVFISHGPSQVSGRVEYPPLGGPSRRTQALHRESRSWGPASATFAG